MIDAANTGSNDFSPLDNPENDCNKCNNEKNVYDTSGAVSKKSDCPGDYQNDRDNIK